MMIRLIISFTSALCTTIPAFGGGWEIEIPDGTGDAGWCIALALDESDKPHISYDYGFVGGVDLMYAYKEGSTWYIEVADNAAQYDTVETSISLDPTGEPRVAAATCHESDGIRIAERNNSLWNVLTLDDGVEARRVALVIDSIGHYHVVYDDRDTNHVKYGYYNGSSWDITSLDTSASGSIHSVSMVADAADHLHLMYSQSDDVKYGYYDGATWQIDVVEENVYEGRLDIAVDVDCEPHGVYYDQSTEYVKYIYYDSGQWNVENVIAQASGGLPDASIAVDSNGEAHIAYGKWNAYTDMDIVYAHRDNGTWQFTVVDDEGDLGLFIDIALDSQGYPHIAYHRCTGIYGELKYAWYNDDVGIDDGTPNTPTGFALLPAVPNPSDGSASIGFAIPRACEVELALYDVKGRKVAVLAEGTHQPGEYSATTSGLSSGVYIYELTADEYKESKKMVVK